ncbi:unnamed protein product [Periconia digitata]|uniref:Uncharacterized protein n=1 Tax=Periconia digitata TaxID=1303443 RepID=A0A9W4U4I4_9PLEO|nr:unnamed protein product [Periconia digitata]
MITLQLQATAEPCTGSPPAIASNSSKSCLIVHRSQVRFFWRWIDLVSSVL